MPHKAFVRPTVERALPAQHGYKEDRDLLAALDEPVVAALVVPDEIVLDILAEKLRTEGVRDDDTARLSLYEDFLKQCNLIKGELVEFLAVMDALHEIRLRCFLVEEQIDVLPVEAELLCDLDGAAEVLRIFLIGISFYLHTVIHQIKVRRDVAPLEERDRINLPVFRITEDGAEAANAERGVHADEQEGVLFELVIEQRCVDVRVVLEIFIPEADDLPIDGFVFHDDYFSQYVNTGNISLRYFSAFLYMSSGIAQSGSLSPVIFSTREFFESAPSMPPIVR